MAKAKSKSQTKSQIATRADLQYLGAFLLGPLFLFIAGMASVALSNAFWGFAHLAQIQQYVMIINAASLALMTLVMMFGFVLYTFAWRRLGTKVGLRDGSRATLATGAAVAVGLMILYSLSSGLPVYTDPDLYVWFDAGTIVFFGLTYVLGWWVARRYAKLK
jgi:hypothetical protein